MRQRRAGQAAASALHHQSPAALTSLAPFFSSSSCPACQPRRHSSSNAAGPPSSSYAPASRTTRVPKAKSPLCHRRTLATSSAAESSHKREKYAVVGGGLTGLTTAYYLAKYRPNAQITLYEASDRLGGWVHTEKRDVTIEGVTKKVQFEWGPRGIPETSLSNCWKFDDLVLWDLLSDLGLRQSVMLAPHMPRWIYLNGGLRRLAPSFEQFLPGGLFEGILSTVFKIKKTQWENNYSLPVNVIPPEEDLSVTEWLTRIGVHPKVIDNLVSAMLHGIHGGSPDTLSARSVFDSIYWRYYQFHDPERIMPQEKEIIEKLGSQTPLPDLSLFEKSGAPTMMHFGPYGMSLLPDTLASTLRGSANVAIQLNSPISDISFDKTHDKVIITTAKRGAPKHQEQYDQVVATIPSQTLASITANKLPSLAKTHSTSMWVVQLWYPYFLPTVQGLGYLIPRSASAAENPHRVLGIMFDHNLGIRGPDEPQGSKLFVLMGGHFYDSGEVQPPTSEAEAIQQAQDLVSRHLGFDSSLPHFAAAKFHAECIPQLTVGHQKRMNEAHVDLRRHFDERLICAGGSYTKPGVLGALRSGFDAANEVLCLNKQYVGTGIKEGTRPVALGDKAIPRLDGVRERFFQGGLVQFLKW